MNYELISEGYDDMTPFEKFILFIAAVVLGLTALYGIATWH